MARKLDKPIEITAEQLSQLITVKMQMLALSSTNKTHLMIITDFETIEVEKKHWYGTRKKIMLTAIDLFGWNTEGKFWGLHDDEAIKKMFWLFDLYKLRQNYVDNIKLPIEALGFEIIKKSKEEELNKMHKSE